MPKFGQVAIIGRPNVGKSTLLNELIGLKVAATANKPQTTRHNLRGILTENDTQIVFVDTPGMHKSTKSLLNKTINQEAIAALEQVDAVLMLVEAGRWQDEDDLVLSRLSYVTSPVLLVANKVDRIKHKEELLVWLQKVNAKRSFAAIVPLSATAGTNVTELKQALQALMPEGDWAYAEDDVTDQSLRFISSELIREQLMTYLHQELPYSTAVVIDSFEETAELTDIQATIWVSRDNQKGMIIGKKGEMLKRIGSSARIALESLLEQKVMLRLWVRVEENWENSPKHLHSLGVIADNGQ